MKPLKQRPLGAWRGVRMRRVLAAADPESAARLVTLPAGWDDAAAAALAALLPGHAPVALMAAAEAWIAPLGVGGTGLDERLRRLLIARRAAPTRAVWRGERAGEAGFVLNLAAFHDPDCGFDGAAFEAAVTTTREALARLGAAEASVGLADLAGLLAALGLDYASAAARALASTIAQRLRATLGGAARAVVAAPGPAEALLGVETGGIAPAFAPLDDRGRLTRTARAILAARGIDAEAALAATLAGRALFPPADAAAHAAMHDAVAPFLDAMPRRPAVPARCRTLPARHGGITQKATVGGHRVYLRTAEHDDGTLGEISVSLPRETPAVRALMEALAHAVSLGLQHGVKLDEFVDAFALTRFAPAGVVEGDPNVARATSVLDYLARTLAAQYLGRTDLPEAEPDDPPPTLPLDLPPAAAGRRGLRVVK
jgi:ribonucleoside-diphosphate reductase alpha chain